MDPVSTQKSTSAILLEQGFMTICKGGFSACATMAFTTTTPVVGWVYGATYYIVSNLVEKVAEKVFDLKLDETDKQILSFVSAVPSIAITGGVLALCGISVSLPLIIGVALSTLLLYYCVDALKKVIDLVVILLTMGLEKAINYFSPTPETPVAETAC